MTEKRISIQS